VVLSFFNSTAGKGPLPNYILQLPRIPMPRKFSPPALSSEGQGMPPPPWPTAPTGGRVWVRPSLGQGDRRVACSLLGLVVMFRGGVGRKGALKSPAI